MAMVALSCLCLLLSGGCKKDVENQDAFVQKWKANAEQSQGSSPVLEAPADSDDKNLSWDEGYEEVSDMLDDLDVEKPLPKVPVSLEMRKANLVAVLAALSKAANLSIMVSPGIQGQVTVSVNSQPWDEVFQGVIKTQGLAYSWEGDILRVKTSDDMKKDVEITALKARSMVQKIMLKRIEPRVTRIIKLRFITPLAMKNIISAVVFHQEVSSYKKTEEAKKGAEALTKEGEEIKVKYREEGDGIGQGEGGQKLSYNVEGYVDIDLESNAIIVQARKPIMKVIYYLVRKLDRPRAQIKIKAWIVETDNATARELGMRYGGMYQYQHPGSPNKFMVGPGGQGGSVQTYNQGWGYSYGSEAGNYNYVNPSGPQSGRYSSMYGSGISGQGMVQGIPLTAANVASGYAFSFLYGVIGENILDMQLLAMQKEGRITILSSPSITTLDNKEALTEDGEEVPYVYYDDMGRPQVQWKDAVLSLKITPQVIDKEHLRMQIQIKKDEVDMTRAVLGVPLIKKKKTETNLVTRSGETIVISGLVRKRADTTENGVPVLKDIPMAGWLFKSDVTAGDHKEVLIFITPRILPPWKPSNIQKSQEQIEKELKEDGIVDSDKLNSMDVSQ